MDWNKNVQTRKSQLKVYITKSWYVNSSLFSDTCHETDTQPVPYIHSYNVSEKAGTVAVTVKRTGNLNQYAIVLCRTEQGTATSTSSVGSRPGQQDYVEYAGQVRLT